MFRTVPLSIIRSFSLYTQQWYMSYSFADSLRTGSGRNQYRTSFVSTWLERYLRKRLASEFLSIAVRVPLNVVSLNQGSAVIATLWGIERHFCGHIDVSSFNLHSLLRTSLLSSWVRLVNDIHYPRYITEWYRKKGKVIQANVYL